MTVKYHLDYHAHVASVTSLWQKLPELPIVEARVLFLGLSDPDLLELLQKLYARTPWQRCTSKKLYNYSYINTGPFVASQHEGKYPSMS
jgi:hypothetical protein